MRCIPSIYLPLAMSIVRHGLVMTYFSTRMSGLPSKFRISSICFVSTMLKGKCFCCSLLGSNPISKFLVSHFFLLANDHISKFGNLNMVNNIFVKKIQSIQPNSTYAKFKGLFKLNA